VRDVLVVGNITWPYGAALDRQLNLQERIMTMDPTSTSHGADDRQGNGWHRVSDLLLVLGMTAVVLGAVLVSQGVPPLQSALHRVPLPYAVPSLVERQVFAPNANPGTVMSPAARVPATPATQTASSGATMTAAVCTPRLDLDHDLRLVLAAMARQRRRTLHATAHVVPPDQQDVPAKDRALARAKEAVARAEASPPAVGLPRGPGC
jgi:hypothetical protein